MFGFLRRLFGKLSRKKEPPPEEAAVEIKEPLQIEPQTEIPGASEIRTAPHSTSEPDRPEKICPKCGSPNDKFVHICWMCKAEI